MKDRSVEMPNSRQAVKGNIWQRLTTNNKIVVSVTIAYIVGTLLFQAILGVRSLVTPSKHSTPIVKTSPIQKPAPTVAKPTAPAKDVPAKNGLSKDEEARAEYWSSIARQAIRDWKARHGDSW